MTKLMIKKTLIIFRGSFRENSRISQAIPVLCQLYPWVVMGCSVITGRPTLRRRSPNQIMSLRMGPSMARNKLVQKLRRAEEKVGRAA